MSLKKLVADLFLGYIWAGGVAFGMGTLLAVSESAYTAL